LATCIAPEALVMPSMCKGIAQSPVESARHYLGYT
jgi:hypothetical protein